MGRESWRDLYEDLRDEWVDLLYTEPDKEQDKRLRARAKQMIRDRQSKPVRKQLKPAV